MTARQRHRQSLLWTIKQWLARRSFYSICVFALSCCLFTIEASAVESKTTEAKPAAFKPIVGKVAVKAPLASLEGESKSADLLKKKPAKKKGPRVVLPKIDPADEEALGQEKTLEGVVGGRNTFGIAVVVETDAAKRSSREIWFTRMKETKLVGVKKGMSEFGDGDKVKVVYKELDENKKKILKSVTLIQKAPPEPVVPDEPEGGLRSDA